MDKSDIGERMKQYENCYRLYLPRRQAVCIRIDGRSFHTFTKGFARPYDIVFAHAMWETTKQLCENISGARIAFQQSDEISIVLTDYDSINTEPWFGNNLQKIVSISAAMATSFFNKAFSEAIEDEYLDWYTECNNVIESEQTKLLTIHSNAYKTKLAVFDSRIFILPREEVLNCLYWRQLDCKRNSIQLAGQSNFSHKQLQSKNCNQIQEMLFQEKGINWSKEPEWFKNGVSIYKKPTEIETPTGEITVRNKWYIDTETPVFTQNRDFIEKHFV